VHCWKTLLTFVRRILFEVTGDRVVRLTVESATGINRPHASFSFTNLNAGNLSEQRDDPVLILCNVRDELCVPFSRFFTLCSEDDSVWDVQLIGIGATLKGIRSPLRQRVVEGSGQFPVYRWVGSFCCAIGIVCYELHAVEKVLLRIQSDEPRLEESGIK